MWPIATGMCVPRPLLVFLGSVLTSSPPLQRLAPFVLFWLFGGECILRRSSLSGPLRAPRHL